MLKRIAAALLGVLGVLVLAGATALAVFTLWRGDAWAAGFLLAVVGGAGAVLLACAVNVWRAPGQPGGLTLHAAAGWVCCAALVSPRVDGTFTALLAVQWCVAVTAGVALFLVLRRRARAQVHAVKLPFSATFAGRVATLAFAGLTPPGLFAFLAVTLERVPVAPAALVLNGLLYLAFLPVVMALHEAGHALAARAAGLRVLRVELGLGPRLWKGKVAGITVSVHLVPMHGLTFSAPRNRSSLKLRMWLMIAAGPAVNLAFVVPAALGSLWSALLPMTTQVAPLPVFILANLITVAPNLLPLRLRLAAGEIETDGAKLLTIPFAGRDRLDELNAAGAILDALEFIEQGNVQSATTVVDEAIRAYPSVFILEYLVATLPQLGGRPDVARARLSVLHARSGLRPGHALLVKNDLAYADALLGDPGLAEEALDLSAQLVRKAPAVAAFLGTRGSVLARFGSLDEAQHFLTQAGRVHTQDRARGETAAWLAFIAQRRGQQEQASRLFDDAERLNPGSATLKILQRAAAVPGEIDRSVPA